ncbi:tetratricopeptide repeat protein [bacterium]|nr:tetratricopeptide repeat protein [bacterium]
MFKKIAALLVLSIAIPAFAAEIPVDAKLDYNQGIDFYKLGMYERAIESFRSAVRTYPDYTDAYYNLGTVLEYLKQYAEALSAYKQVYVRNPNDYEVIYKMAFLSSKLEDYDKMAEYINLIPPSSNLYQRGKELSESIKAATTLPPKQIIKPSRVANYPGVYENLLSPTGVTTDALGNVYVATFSDNSVIKITPDGKRQIFYKSQLVNGPISLASDSIGNIYISNYNSNNVLKISPQGVAVVLVSNVDKPYGLHVDGNMLFITCQGSNAILRHKLDN